MKRPVLLTTTLVLVALVCIAWVVHHRWVYWYRYTDFGKLRERARFDVGVQRLRDLAVSPDGHRLYVVDEPKTGEGTVHVVDAATGSVTASIALGLGFPVSVSVTPDGSYALVTVSQYRGGKGGGGQSGENGLVVIDTASHTVARTVRIPGTSASGIGILSDSRSAYVSNRVGSYLVRVDPTVGTVSVINVPQGPYAVAMKHGSDFLYLVSTRVGKTNRISVLDTKGDRITATIETKLERSVSECRAVFSPDSRRLYVANGEDSRVCVVDTDPDSATFHQQVALIETKGSPIFGLALNAAGTLALVLKANHQILLLDIAEDSRTFHRVVDKVRVGGSPEKFFAVTPANGRPLVYVGDREDGRIRVLSPGGG